MSLFSNLDARLAQFATEQQAVLTQNRGGTSLLPAGPNRTGFEERRIDWQLDEINRAIIIQPDFRTDGADSTRWHFRAVAWYGGGHQKRRAGQNFATAVRFPVIEEQLEGLLEAARIYLNNIRMSNLQLMPYLREQ